MDTATLAGIGVVLWAVVFTWLGGWVASQCGRNPIEGAKLGLVFGPLGVILEALLPRKHRD